MTFLHGIRYATATGNNNHNTVAVCVFVTESECC